MPPSPASVGILNARRVIMLDGTPVLLRPLKPDDAVLYPDFLA